MTTRHLIDGSQHDLLLVRGDPPRKPRPIKVVVPKVEDAPPDPEVRAELPPYALSAYIEARFRSGGGH